MKLTKKIKTIHMLLLAVATIVFVGVTASSAATFEPGTAEDPIVSQSYVDSKVNDLNIQIQNLKQQIQALSTTGQPQEGAKYVKVGPIAAGKQIIAGESTEIVLRAGTATAIASTNGGVGDLTSGIDLNTGDQIAKNHLLLVPMNDGRGLNITSKETWLMIRGSYTIK